MKQLNLSWPAKGAAVLTLLAVAAMLAEAQDTSNQKDAPVSAVQARPSWEYARLVLNDSVAAWQAGETNVDPEALRLEALYRRLGGTFRPNLTNLLNLVGRDGWELVSTDETVWTFKRHRQ